MEENTRPQPGERQRPAAHYWLAPALLAAVALLAVLALQVACDRQPAASQPAAAPTTAPVAVVQTQPAATATVTAAPRTAQPSPTATESATPPTAPPSPVPGALASVDDVQRIEPAEAKALVDQGQAVIYDVRSETSYATAHAAGAILLAYDQVEAQASTLPKDKILILYCT